MENNDELGIEKIINDMRLVLRNAVLTMSNEELEDFYNRSIKTFGDGTTFVDFEKVGSPYVPKNEAVGNFIVIASRDNVLKMFATLIDIDSRKKETGSVTNRR